MHVLYWLPVYPLIRDRCEPLGSHRESKNLEPVFSSHSLFFHLPCQDTAPYGLASRATLHTDAREQNGDRNRVKTSQRKVSLVSSNVKEQGRYCKEEGLLFIKPSERGKGDFKVC